jgi:hypothetical protein
MRDELQSLIPEFGQIADASLREKTLAVWEDALKRGGFSLSDLKRMPFTILVDGVAISFIEHVRTVAQLCIAMTDILVKAYGDRVKISKDHLVAGAMLADVGKVMEYQERDGKFVKSRHGKYLRHPFTGVGLAFAHGLPDEVMHVIAVHSKEGEGFKRSPEAIIFHHADFTDFELVQ